jgi:hypothetical protein
MSWRDPDKNLRRFKDTTIECWAEALEGELTKARKHSTMLQSKLDSAFT